ncbi:hypothetical protein [Spirosoma sp.]|uniref:hypothetical protein n=1 Tax=Spirosoma sp. TaxID=1899569 RepID=UPI0026336BAB|nr:hypothetical protein [Spirosoma sp.]MCX6216397.1 hypothetical protein [Spirosoma sp.]
MSSNLLPQSSDKTPEQKRAERLDKFRDHLLYRVPLKPSEHAMLDKYRKCFAWRGKLFSPQQCVNMLMQEYGVKYSQAYQIMMDSTKLYGKVEDLDKAGTTKILIETLYVAMSIAVKDRNAEAIIAATRQIGVLAKLNDDQVPLSVDELMPARVARYTQNNITVNNFGTEGQAGE